MLLYQIPPRGIKNKINILSNKRIRLPEHIHFQELELYQCCRLESSCHSSYLYQERQGRHSLPLVL